MTDPQQQALPPLPDLLLTFLGEDRIWEAIEDWGHAPGGRSAIKAAKLIDSRIKDAMRAYAAEAVARALAASAPSREATIQPGLKVPDGWKLVPIEPTEEMCAAAVKLANGDAVYKNVPLAALKVEESIYGEAYAAMLSAAPSSPSVAAEETGHG